MGNPHVQVRSPILADEVPMNEKQLIRGALFLFMEIISDKALI